MNTYKITIGKLTRKGYMSVLNEVVINTDANINTVRAFYRKTYPLLDIEISNVETVVIDLPREGQAPGYAGHAIVLDSVYIKKHTPKDLYERYRSQFNSFKDTQKEVVKEVTEVFNKAYPSMVVGQVALSEHIPFTAKVTMTFYGKVII